MTSFFSGASRVWIVLGAITAVFHIGLIFYGLVPNLVARPLHMALILPWVFLYSAKTPLEWWSGASITAIGVAGCVWIALNQQMLRNQYGFLEDQFQVVLAITLLLIAMEGARRMIGWPLPLVALCALLYGLYGQNIPGEFGHAGTPLRSFLGTLVIAEGGLWGSLTGGSVGVVAIFVIFGAVLNAGEAGQGFMNVAAAAAGRLTGGAAKVSVLSSALFGSISGSASANVASTGAITLPAMTKLGYPKRLAAAVEAVASSGGQIMPPLMGAGAFVMQRFELQAVPEDQRPSTRVVAITSIFFLVPFSVLLFAMFIAGFTPQYAAVIAIFAGVAVLFFDATPRMGLRQGITRLGDALRAIGQQVAMIAAIIICASIIIGVLGITGLGIKITSVILSGSGGTLWPALLLTALACLLLGMEVPTTAAYVICVSVAGPALTQLGLEPLQAHLFVFWFALLSTITPPVCGAVFIAAGMIGENWLKVALTAMALGVGLYIIPLAMIANPDMIRIATNTTGALIAFVMVGIGLSCLSYALIGRAGWLRRTLLAVGGFIACFAGAFLP